MLIKEVLPTCSGHELAIPNNSAAILQSALATVKPCVHRHLASCFKTTGEHKQVELTSCGSGAQNP